MGAALRCASIRAAFDAGSVCEETEMGLRFVTHCLYPSFEPVSVYVVRKGENDLVIHDGGGAARSAWAHGRDHGAITAALKAQAAAHDLAVLDDTLTLAIQSVEWLTSAILAVANASSAAASSAIAAVKQTSDTDLRSSIFSVLKGILGESQISSNYELRGKSGKRYSFDFAVSRGVGNIILIDAVSPHHVSIASKYVALSDTHGSRGDFRGRFVVHDKPLENDDVALLGQFADVLPISALKPRFSGMTIQ